ncbi:hypothetical protein WJX77_011396 [Trebouxia sp. C0004]
MAAARMVGGYSRVMPEPYSVSNASRSQQHNPPSLAVAASEDIYAARGRSATVVNYAGQAIGSKPSTKRSTSKTRAGITHTTGPPLIKHGAGEWLQKHVLTAGKTAGDSAANIKHLNSRCREKVWDDLGKHLLVVCEHDYAVVA